MKTRYSRPQTLFTVALLTLGALGCDALKNKDPVGGSGTGGGGGSPQTQAEIDDPVSLFTATLVGALDEWNPTQPPIANCGRVNINGVCVPPGDLPRRRLDYGNCPNAFDQMTGSAVITYTGGINCTVGAGREGIVTYNFQRVLNSGLTLVTTTDSRASAVGEVIGGGAVLSPIDSTLNLWRLRIPGINYEVKNAAVSLSKSSIHTPNGGDFSIATTSFARTSRTVNTGQLRLIRSQSDVQTASFSGLRWNNPNCCFPTSGQLLIKPSGSTEFSTRVTYLQKCGAYEVTFSGGRPFTGELTHCGGSAQW